MYASLIFSTFWLAVSQQVESTRENPVQQDGSSPTLIDNSRYNDTTETESVSQVILPQEQQESIKDSYRLGNGDTLVIKIWSGDFFEQGMSGEYMILSDGSVALPVVGQVHIAEHNEQEASVKVVEALSDYIINPIVQINIKTHRAKQAHVLGAVNTPGPIIMDRPMTLLTALSKASLSRTKRHDGAWAAQKIYLQKQDGSVEIIELEGLLQRGIGNRTLEHGDIIYVADGAYVYVNGEIEKPGGVPFRPGMTITDALSHAGGATSGANLKEVYILRNGKRIHINVKSIFQGKTPDVDLQEGDRLFIEESIW